jgi:hypothetical protein
MTITITPEESKELQLLWQKWRDATMLAMHIMGTEGTDGAALPKILAEDKKAGDAINRIQEIHRGEGKSTSFPGARKPPQTLK